MDLFTDADREMTYNEEDDKMTVPLALASLLLPAFSCAVLPSYQVYAFAGIDSGLSLINSVSRMDEFLKQMEPRFSRNKRNIAVLVKKVQR